MKATVYLLMEQKIISGEALELQRALLRWVAAFEVHESQ